MNRLSGRQKKKFRRIVNKSIQAGIKPESIPLPADLANELEKQVYNAFYFKGKKLNEH